MSEDLMDIDWVLSEIKSMMEKLNVTVSVAESLTAGKLQDLFVKQTGASSYFEGGMTVYSIDQKVYLLGVDREVAEECNCVSQIVADQMAEGVANKFVTDYGISTTGYAETYHEGGESWDCSYISIYNLKEGKVNEGHSSGICGDRESVRKSVAESSVRLFYLTLLKKVKESNM